MMKKVSTQFFLYSLTSLAVTASSLAYAQQDAQAPSFEGGLTASIGTFYAAPVSGNQDYVAEITGTDNFDTFADQQIYEVNSDYDFGFEASLGYVFDETANSMELSYRTLDSDGDGSVEATDFQLVSPVFLTHYDLASSTIDFDFSTVDLMFYQFLDIGTHVQTRFGVGVSYVEIEKNQNSTYIESADRSEFSDNLYEHSEFSGVGPRVGIDGRYDFGEDLAGFGIVAGGSLAYYVGDLDVDSTQEFIFVGGEYSLNTSEELDNHGVTNLRANVGIDYVYFFANEESTLGIELGYLVDYYADANGDFIDYEYNGDYHIPTSTAISSFSYSGPYVNLKGVF